MPQIQMIYGPHCDSDFINLRPVLESALQGIREISNNIHSILEYLGPHNDQFQEISNFLTNTKDETLFRDIRLGLLHAINNYVQTRDPSIDIGNSQFHLTFGPTSFQCNLINSLAGCTLHLEEPQYNDWNRIRPYSKGGSFQGSINQRNENLIDNLEDIETSFRNLIRKLINQYDEPSFIIIRGDMHRFYFGDIITEFESEYEIPDFLTYGTLYQRSNL